MPDSLPRAFGRYELVELLGEGGMARVYKARIQGPSGFSRHLAIKVMHSGVGQDEVLRQALVTEARVAGLLHHPGVVAVHDFGDVDGQPFVAMEWVDGVDLSRLLAHGGPLPPVLAMDVGIALAEALHYVHTLDGPDGPLKLVHRDLKPSNVLVGRAGQVKLMDFGLARAEGLVRPTLASRVAAAMGERSQPGLLEPTEAVSASELPSGGAFREERSSGSAVASVVADPQVRRGFLGGVFGVLGALAGAAVILTVRSMGPAPAEVPEPPAEAPLPTVRTQQLSPGADPEGEPAVSPDGTRIVFVRVQGGWRLWLKDLATEQETPVDAGDLEHLSQPAWMPDGQALVVHARRPLPGLYLLPLDGSPPTRLTERGAHPAPSPDGTRLAHTIDHVSRPTAKRQTSPLFVVDLQTLESTEVWAGDANQPSWSPDGRIAVWSVEASGQRDVYVVDPATGEAVAVTDDDALDWSPVWAPDGRHLYFFSDRGGAYGLFRVSVDGSAFGPPQLLAGATASPGYLTIDGSGRRLVYDTEAREENIQLVPIADGRATGEAQWLTRGARTAVWSEPEAGGQRVIWVEDRGQEDLWVGAVGEPARRLTNDRYRERQPHWIGPGKAAFYSDRDGGWGLWTVDVDTGEVSPLAPNNGLSAFAVADDGRIAATDQGSNAVYLVTPDGQRRRALLEYPPDVKPHPSTWSPDGRVILEGARAGSGGKWIGTWDPATSALSEVQIPATGMFRWVSDAAVVASSRGAVVRLDWPDGEPEVVHRNPEGTNVGWIGVSPDRQWMTVHADRESTALWLWELAQP